MQRTFWLLGVTIALTVVCTACSGASPQPESAEQDWQPQSGVLPSLAELESLTQPTRTVSQASYELLYLPPVATSGVSAELDNGILNLSPAKSGNLAWSIFRLGLFPEGGEVLPTAITVEKDKLLWLGLSDYGTNSWSFTRLAFSGTIPLEDAASLISPSGSLYVALVVQNIDVTTTKLEVTTNADLPGLPKPDLSVLTNTVEQFPITFNAQNSSGGDGAITKVVYDFGDGSESVEKVDPAENVDHTYLVGDTYDVTLTVYNDLGFSASAVTPLTVAELQRELLVVYNSDMPEDLDLVAYYMSVDTGRAVDPDYMLGLPLGAAAAQTISRANYVTDIRDPIKDFLNGNPAIKSNVKYLLMMKGVPYRIPGADGGNHDQSMNSCVDSELCLLYSGGGEGEGGYRLQGAVWNESAYHDWNGDGFYLSGDVEFTPDAFTVTDLNGANWPLNLLVCRLTAYTYANAKELVDRSLAADTSSNGWVIFDAKPGSVIYDTMVDPVWPMDDDSWDSGVELLTAAGLNVVGDITSDKLNDAWSNYPPGFVNSLLGYCSWGVHSGWSKTYILEDLNFNYVPGACFMSYESINGVTMRATNPADPAEGHPSQGQIADFLYMGGTVAIGNVYEPWTDGVGDERWVFDRYINHGDRWIEAAYKGLAMLSWQEVVVGDPLCQVK